MILDGKKPARQIRDELQKRMRSLPRSPKLVSLAVQPDDATQSYLQSQGRAAEKLGISFEMQELAGESCMQKVLGEIARLNGDEGVDGVLVAHPLPAHLDEIRVLQALDPKKDVEGRTPTNMGLLLYESPVFYPCTAEAVLYLLDYYHLEVQGKAVTIIGRSNTVGRPLALMMLERKRSATPTVCHSRTENLAAVVSNSDILVVAAGKAGLIKVRECKPGAIILDVGINVVDGRISGDVERDPSAEESMGLRVSPVPGGVGPVTTALLLRNVVHSALQGLQA